MKRLLAVFFLFVCSVSMGQVNKVKNPSFEEYSECPTMLDEIKFATHWMCLDSSWSPPDWAHAPLGNPDFCNVCAGFNPHIGVPNSGWYYQFPHTGMGFSMAIMFYDETINTLQQRDYLQGHLTETLIAGQAYCVSFYVSLANEIYAVNHIGAYFDDGTIDTTRFPGKTQTHCLPQVFTTSIINDTANWVKIQGSFIATGNERLITIGNFTDRAHTSFVPAPGIDTTGIHSGGVGGYSNYLIDDVSVIAIDATINAGADQVITGADSVTIGDTLDSYLPTYWYANGSLIDSNTAWLRVRPDTTTMYVVELSRCGGDNITDTVWVYVGALVASPGLSKGAVMLLPNPAQGKVTVSGAAGGELFIFDMVGREVLRSSLVTDNKVVDISGVAPGVYMAQVVMPDGGRKCVRVAVQ